MNNSKFRAIPKPSNFKIPFKLDEAQLLNWLSNLTRYESQEACLLILRLIQALNELNITTHKRILFLKIIATYLKQYLSHLEGICWDAGFPLSMAEIIYAEAVTWNYLLLGQGFFIAAEQGGKKEEDIFSLAMALQAMGQAQLHIAAVYAVPNDGFWALVYKVFALAEKRKLLDVEVNNTHLKGITLKSLFKKTLIFQLCDNTQFRPRDMHTIFDFIDRVCINSPIDKAINTENKEEEGIFLIDLNSDNPPFNINNTRKKLKPASSSTRYFSSITVARDIYEIIKQGKIWTGSERSVNNSLFRRVIKTLGLKSKRKYRRLHDDHNVLGVIGFENIIDFLYRKNTAIGLPNNDPSITFLLNQELKALVDCREVQTIEDVSDKSPTDDIWSKYLIREVDVKKVTIFDSSAKGYSVYWNDADLKAKIGDVIGIISTDNKRLEIVLIRRIAMSLGKYFRFGVEIIGFESEVVYLTSHDSFENGVWAIFIPGIKPLKQPDTLIYEVSQFEVGDKVCIHKKDNEKIYCQLGADLHSTSSTRHIEISY
jgi:hypothetical protein